MAVASAVQREWGYSGYYVRPIGSTWLGDGTFEVSCTDGARFILNAGRYGNVTELRATASEGRVMTYVWLVIDDDCVDNTSGFAHEADAQAFALTCGPGTSVSYQEVIGRDAGDTMDAECL